MFDVDEPMADRYDLTAFGIEFDFKCSGYIREHGHNFIQLADVLYQRDPDDWNPFPQPLLFSLTELDRTAPVKSGGSTLIQPDPASALTLATEGNRNVTLYHHVREWVNRRDPGTNRDAWNAQVLAQASTYNSLMSVPLDGAEVRVLAFSLATRQWEHWQGRNGYYRHDPELQSARGIRSGQARRAKTEGRDEAILDFASEGWSQRQLAKHFELSRNAIVNVLRRGGP